MSTLELGPLLALVGMVVLLLSGWARRSARKEGKQKDPHVLRQQRWLYGTAYALILLGLFLMWGKK